MTEKDMNLPASDEAVDAILAEVLGKEGSHMVKRYSGEGESIPVPQAKEEPVVQQPQTPPVAAPKNKAPVSETSPEMIEADYRSAAAKYEVNGYRFSAPPAPAYAPYPAYPAYPAYPQPVAYVPYPAYPAYPAYPQPYGYPQYPTGYEGYAEYPTEQPQAAPEQDNQQNPYAAAAGSRVVYDADWAEPGRQAPKQKQTSQQPSVPVMQANASGKPHVNPAFIDPLSAYEDDETIPSPYTDTVSFAERHNAKNPQPQQKKQGTDFFPAGFSATKNNTVAANGKTAPVPHAATDSEAVFAGFSDDYEKTANRRQEWMMTDEELQQVRDRRRKEAEDALLQTAEELKNTIPSAKADDFTPPDEEAQRKAEAQQIIAERFSQAAAQEIIYNSTETFENDPVEEDVIFPADPYSDTEYKGESELYYNNPNEPEVNETEEVSKKKKGNKFTAFIRRNTPHKGQTKREFISCLIMDLAFVVLIGGLVFCGFYLKNYMEELQRGKIISTDIYEERMSDKYTEVQLEEWWKNLKADYPDIDYPDNLNPDFARLYTVNQDVAGWLEIEGVDLATVILQADDNDYYLYRDLYKEQTKYGTPFVDYRNSMSSTELSRNTIIYGHNTHDGLKFYNLTRYLQLSGYKAAPIVKLNTLYNGMTYWKVFAVTLSDSSTDEFEYLYTSFNSETAFTNLINDIRAHSMFDIDVDVAAGDNIITLYTCYQNLFEDGRLTVFARQVRAGEDLNVNVDNATVNSDCIYPNAYYGITYENSTSAITGTTQAAVSDENATEALIPEATLPPEDATEEGGENEEDIVFGDHEEDGGETPQDEESEGEESLG